MWRAHAWRWRSVSSRQEAVYRLQDVYQLRLRAGHDVLIDAGLPQRPAH
jgi:hypothetical protein